MAVSQTEEFLSQAWFEAVLQASDILPGMAEMSASVNFELTGAKSSKGSAKRFHAVLSDGRLSEFGEGKLPGADCSVSSKLSQALAIVKGEADAEVGYMQGWLKIEGDYGALVFALRPLYGQAQWKEFARSVANLTKDS